MIWPWTKLLETSSTEAKAMAERTDEVVEQVRLRSERAERVAHRSQIVRSNNHFGELFADTLQRGEA